jgi:hypothetical protein
MINGHNEWDVLAEFMISHCGLPREEAKAFAIIHFMGNGDFRPLAAAILHSEEPVDRACLVWLAKLINNGQLKLVRKGKHRPKSPTAEIKRIVAALLHENSDCSTRNEKVREVAERLGMSPEGVKEAVTRWRKGKRRGVDLIRRHFSFPGPFARFLSMPAAAAEIGFCDRSHTSLANSCAKKLTRLSSVSSTCRGQHDGFSNPGLRCCF